MMKKLASLQILIRYVVYVGPNFGRDSVFYRFTFYVLEILTLISIGIKSQSKILLVGQPGIQ